MGNLAGLLRKAALFSPSWPATKIVCVRLCLSVAKEHLLQAEGESAGFIEQFYSEAIRIKGPAISVERNHLA